MFSEAIGIWGAHISKVLLSRKAGIVTTRLEVTALMTSELAEILGCSELLFWDNGVAKSGFSEMGVDAECRSARVLFEPDPALKQNLEINIDQADEFWVERIAEGRLRMKCKLSLSGDPHPAINYWLLVGDSDAALTITPLQKEMEAADGSEVEIHVKMPDGSRHIEPVAKETVRAALGAASKHRKGMVN